MSSQEKSFERINQKRRTRAELLRAARELTEKGGSPSVAEVADHAGISRATAYRYFSTPDEMIREAVLDAVANSIRLEDAGPDTTPMPVDQRLQALVGRVFAMLRDNETTFRAFLAGTVTGRSQVKRGARRLGWLSEALDPLRAEIPAADFQRLVYGLSLMTGIETLVVLKDVCSLDDAEAEEVTLWAARTLLAGVLSARSE
ncbi:TetR/AcrR family transcriptional regulator [Rhizobium sp. S-51]|uniref:TetR/AcrR family transcriptional regulator n=1 Tax=Rhizobium terricola TaxID=2728849 RepID=A0A7Y0ATK8_9HYPH|nr:TetR/AcrR family transcriptional regulator [Rhizobium terricola]NML73256.1 TetR/AcrR family transcriptional regulator [Rhizobium terricola]